MFIIYKMYIRDSISRVCVRNKLNRLGFYIVINGVKIYKILVLL